MTLMGKIFTMLVLVLSVMFLGLSLTVFVTVSYTHLTLPTNA